MNKILPYVATFLFISSCNYTREQRLPEGIGVLSETDCSIGNSYSVKRYLLKGLDSINMEQWNDYLTCEHYSDFSSSLQMSAFKSLSEQEKRNIKFFLVSVLKCKGSKVDISSSDDLWFSGCRTENKSQSTDINFDYDMLCIIDKNQSVMYKFKYLN